MVFTLSMSAASFLRNLLKVIDRSGDKNELKPDDNKCFDDSFGYRQNRRKAEPLNKP